MKLIIREKKGDVPDILVFLITVFILAVGLFVISYTTSRMADEYRAAGLNSSAEGESAVDSIANLGEKTLQRGFLLLFAGLIMGTMVSSFLTRVHPIFLIVYFFFLGLTVFIGIYLANAYETLANIPTFADTLASQTLITLIMQNMIPIIIGVGALSMVIVFAKFSSFGGNTQKI